MAAGAKAAVVNAKKRHSVFAGGAADRLYILFLFYLVLFFSFN
jgi:hypothetical protein